MLAALLDERCLHDIVAAIGRGEELRTERGCIRFAPTRAFARLRGDENVDLTASAAPVQGSNTAITLGDRLFLKAYRRIAPGTNPEFEIGRFLTEAVPFDHVAALAGAVEYVDDSGRVQTLAVLQQYLPNQGRAWDYTLDYLERFLDDVRSKADADDREAHSVYLEMIGTLGTRTAGLHLALATPTGDPAFDPRPIERADLRSWTERACELASATLAELELQRAAWPTAAAPHAAAVLQRRDELLRTIAEFEPKRVMGVKTRHHGNFDLGQALVTHNDFVIVDFERARRDDRPAGFDSPLRDVAALARSLSYAGGHALARALTRRPDDHAVLERGKARWSALARQRFLDCYEAAMRERGSTPPPADGRALLRLFEIERILHDIRRQLGMRPDLLHITLCSLLELLRRPGGRGSTRRDGA